MPALPPSSGAHPGPPLACPAQTAALSVGVGTACTLYEPMVVLEALVLTASIVVALTAYTFYAVRKGVSFSFLGPALFSGLMLLGELPGGSCMPCTGCTEACQGF